MQISIHGETNVGNVRANNEDSFIAEPIWDDHHSLAVVIDGVGGYEGGEVAAKIAHEKIREYLLNVKNGDQDILLKEAVVHANEAIYKERQNNPKYREMSCVLTACMIDLGKRQLYMAHVGDSRLYVYNGGRLTKLSHDHSLIGYREEIGELSEEDAMNHPQRNIINRDVGSKLHKTDDENFIESAIFPIAGDSMMLLCSDGLSDMVTSREIMACLTRKGTVQQKCHYLIEAALRAGGVDNVTVVLAIVQEEDAEEKVAVANVEDTKVDIKPQPPQEVQPPTAPPAVAEKQTKKRRFSVGTAIVFFILGIVAGGLALFYLEAPIKQLLTPAVKPHLGTPGTIAADSLLADSLYNQLIDAQGHAPDTFYFSSKATVIKITRPLLIFKNGFFWKQPGVVTIEPADSVKCPVGLIISGNDVQLKNILFNHFKKDSIVVHKKERQP